MNTPLQYIRILLDDLTSKIQSIEEVTDWIKSNCQGEWEIHYGPQMYENSRGDHIDFSHSVIIIGLQDPNDAVIFKLRWN